MLQWTKGWRYFFNEYFCLFASFSDITDLQYFINPWYTTLCIDISIHFKMTTTINLVTIYHCTKILHNYWIYSIHYFTLLISLIQTYFNPAFSLPSAMFTVFYIMFYIFSVYSSTTYCGYRWFLAFNLPPSFMCGWFVNFIVYLTLPMSFFLS